MYNMFLFIIYYDYCEINNKFELNSFEFYIYTEYWYLHSLEFCFTCNKPRQIEKNEQDVDAIKDI